MKSPYPVKTFYILALDSFWLLMELIGFQCFVNILYMTCCIMYEENPQVRKYMWQCLVLFCAMFTVHASIHSPYPRILFNASLYESKSNSI